MGILGAVGMVLLRPFALSSATGARTSMYLASSPEVDGVSGQYFYKCRVAEAVGCRARRRGRGAPVGRQRNVDCGGLTKRRELGRVNAADASNTTTSPRPMRPRPPITPIGRFRLVSGNVTMLGP